jgi:hypothetical protein
MSEARNRPVASFTLSPEALGEIARLAQIEDRSRSWIVDQAIHLFGKTYDRINAQALVEHTNAFVPQQILHRAMREHEDALSRAAEQFRFVSGVPRPADKQAHLADSETPGARCEQQAAGLRPEGCGGQGGFLWPPGHRPAAHPSLSHEKPMTARASEHTALLRETLKTATTQLADRLPKTTSQKDTK